MKNLINYYYNLLVQDFKKVGEIFYFKIGNLNYQFSPFTKNLNNFYKTYILINRLKKYCYKIIFNREDSFVTLYEGKPYILMSDSLTKKINIELFDILDYDIPIYENYSLNWKDLWEKKIDYYEYQVNQFGFRYNIIRDSFSYYVGLSECAINMLNYIDKSKVQFYISHRRLNLKSDYNDFFNPINLLLDNRTRDISEYFKLKYIDEDITITDIINELKEIQLENYEAILLLSRLIYPSYYFDIYDKIVEEKINEEKIEEYIKKNVYYETFLKEIYKYLKNNYRIPQVEWLEY